MVEEAFLNVNGRFLDSKHKAKRGHKGYLVPLRHIAENMGAEVSWKPERGVVILQKKGSVYELNVGSTRVIANGRREELPELIRTYHGHIFAPVDFMAKALDAKTCFSEDTQILTLLRQEPALLGRTILLDPGHGGQESGAIVNNLHEKELTLDILQRAARLLATAGLSVKVTRELDKDVDQQARLLMAANLSPDIFLSIHINSSINQDLEGIEAYYYASWRSQRLAGEILSETVAETRSVNRGVREAAFYLLRHSPCPGAHIECGFLTHPEERRKLSSAYHRELIAFGLFRGIRNYLETSLPSEL